ncbi:MAG: hypothetical protein CMJ77_10410 [Planctomycetaceae bacterium]|nr:hypothetical protein [Planctomycetaceae bacterium]
MHRMTIFKKANCATKFGDEPSLFSDDAVLAPGPEKETFQQSQPLQPMHHLSAFRGTEIRGTEIRGTERRDAELDRRDTTISADLATARPAPSCFPENIAVQ